MSNDHSDFYDQGFGGLVKDTDRYMVLEFESNRKFKGVSGLVAFTDDNSMVFLRSGYEDVVRPGEIWLCSVNKNENGIRYARPMDQVTLSMLMQMNEDLRRAIEDALWDRNRSAYEGAFRQRFMAEEYARIREEIDEENRKAVGDLESRIRDLELQLEQKQFALETMSIGDEAEEIVLSSEPTRPGAATEPSPASYRGSEPPRLDEGPLPRAFKVRRFGPRSFQSEYFTGRRCFVHISPSRKYVLVRFHDDGNIYCFNHTISIGGLEKIVDYVEGAEYNAEYSKKYNGILINLLSG